MSKFALSKKTSGKTKNYFTKEHEDAIIAYNASTDDRERNRIFNESIYEPLCKIAETVFYTYKFPYQETSNEDVQAEALAHMVANLSKYNPANGKAYSYFTIVAKNWFIAENTKNFKRFKRNVEIIDEPTHDEEPKNAVFVIEPDHRKVEARAKERLDDTIAYWTTNLDTTFPAPRERMIASSVLEMLNRSSTIDLTNRKALCLYLREFTQCTQNELAKVLRKMKLQHQLANTTNPSDVLKASIRGQMAQLDNA